MSLLTSTGRSLLRLLALVAIVVVLVSSGSGMASAATGASSKPKVDGFAVAVVKSTGDYWGPVLSRLGHPEWQFYYFIIKRSKLFQTPCGLLGDPDVNRSAAPVGYCPSNNTVYLSTQWLYNHTSNNGTTPYGFANAIAHEVGHAVQAELRLPDASVKRSELQADCFSAMWVRDQVNIGAATNKDALDARTAAQTGGDYEVDSPEHHGTADERVISWTIGYNRGFNACLAVNPVAGEVLVR